MGFIIPRPAAWQRVGFTNDSRARARGKSCRTFQCSRALLHAKLFYSLSLDRLVPQDDFYRKGMVSGKRQAIDSAFIKANASKDSLLEEEVVDDVSVYADELNEGSEFKVSAEKKKLVCDFLFIELFRLIFLRFKPSYF